MGGGVGGGGGGGVWGGDEVPLASFGDLGANDPEGLGLEGCYFLMPLHAEGEGGGLAGAIADHCSIQISILALQYTCLLM